MGEFLRRPYEKERLPLVVEKQNASKSSLVTFRRLPSGKEDGRKERHIQMKEERRNQTKETSSDNRNTMRLMGGRSLEYGN